MASVRHSEKIIHPIRVSRRSFMVPSACGMVAVPSECVKKSSLGQERDCNPLIFQG